ncbi:MAG: helix-hairpin-helix domain-containing protein [Planctomycetota bacterium]
MPEPVLRRLDQLPLAVITAAALASMAVWWVAGGGPSGRLINIDRAQPLDYRFTVDINSADWPELVQLPEIGEVLARRIVEHRAARGPFDTPEDLLEVPGIGEKTLDRVRGYLRPLPGEELTAGQPPGSQRRDAG